MHEQIEYYRARAPEYDEAFLRTGAFQLTTGEYRQWSEEIAVLEAALGSFNPRGRVLELACGSGWWTTQLARYADEIVAVDAAPEMIEKARHRLSDTRIEFIEADLFNWKPTERFNVVFFSFWLSHVPAGRFERFWDLVSKALLPRGRIFFIDSADNPPIDDAALERLRRVQPVEFGDGTVIRRLNDGREFRMVKVYHRPEDFETRLRTMGWDARVEQTSRRFLYGYGQRSDEIV